MNNFYASVECMLDPALKKYPIAVCGSVEERHGIVLAKNYKAKAFDVKTGDAVWQAKQKCKDLVVVPPHYEEYIKYSKLARSVYERYTDQVEPYGMDECWLDISGTESLFGSPEKVANEIRETMKFELGLTISVGVSFNKIFAKLGSDMKKPDAVTVIPKDTFKEKIWGLPAADLLGVGRATQRVLDSYCIRTIGDLANNDPEFLRRRLGKNGVVLWNYANGNDLSLVAKKDFVSPIKSVGHGITTVADLEKPEQVWPVFLELTQDIGHKLRVHGLSAEGVAIHIRDNTLNTRQWQTKIALPTQSPMIIAKTAFQLFEKRYGWNNPIRSVTVQAINLVPQDTPRQIDMFMDAAKQDKLERMEKCVEEIRRRFGKDSIRNGVLCQNLRLPPEKAEITMPTGMTSFTEMGVQAFEDDDNEAFFFLDGKTVLVEKDLNFDSKLKGRKNFTLMHEGSHQIFKMLFPNDYGVTQKSAGVHYYKANSERNKPISDWEEWQANTLGAAILLPENLIKQGMYLFSLGEKIECLNKIYFPGVYKRFDALADFLGCSKKALAIRMKQLGLLKKEYLDNPFDLVTVYPEVSEL